MNDRSAHRLLLVEDEALIAMAETRMLRRNGFEVAAVGSGEEAIQLLDGGEAFDLVLMDIDLGGGMYGTEAARILIERHQVPVLFLSSHTESSIVEKTENITSYGYVVKNSGETVLLASIRMAFKLHEATRTIRRSEERFRLTFHTNPDSINVNRLEDGLYVDINEGFTRITGYTREDVIGKSSLAINIWADPADRQELVRGLKARGYYSNLEARFRRKDGAILHGLMSARIIDLDGAPHIISISRDVTEHRGMQSALRASEERFRLLFEHASDAIMMQTLDDRIVDANQKACRLLGYEKSELVGKYVAELQAPEVRQAGGGIVRGELAAHGGKPFEALNVGRDGRKIPIEITVTQLPEPHADLTLTIIRDIGERQRAREEIKRTLEEKNALLGELHHRVRNSLSMIGGLVGLESARSAQPAVRSALEDLRGRIESLANLHEILQQSGGISKLRLDEFFGRIAGSFKDPFVKDRPGLRFVESYEALVIETRRAAPFGLILNELVTNALKYAFPGNRAGTVWIELARDGEQLVLAVADDGAGLPEGFDPKRSPGFGIQLVNILTAQLNGSFSFERNPRTAFFIRIPEH